MCPFPISCNTLICLSWHKLRELICAGLTSHSVWGWRTVHLRNVLWRRVCWWRSVQIVIRISLWVTPVTILKWTLVGLLNWIYCGASGWGSGGCYIRGAVRCLIWITIHCLTRLDNGRVSDCSIRIAISRICRLSESWYIRDIACMRVCLGNIPRIPSGFPCWINSWVSDSLYHRVSCLWSCLWIHIPCDLCDSRSLNDTPSGLVLLHPWLRGGNNMRIWTLPIVTSSIGSILSRKLLVLSRAVCYSWSKAAPI